MNQSYDTAIKYTASENKTFAEIKLLHDKGDKFFLLLGEAKHKIKKKAEQQACFSSARYYIILSIILLNVSNWKKKIKPQAPQSQS